MSLSLRAKFILIPVLSLVGGVALADTADDCIADYEALKAQFETASIDAEYECIRIGTALNLFATGTPPLECEGEDEWHLVAKSVVGNPGRCKLRILGHKGEGCEAAFIEHELVPREAAQWQNYINAECRALGTIRGIGSTGGGDN